MRGGQVLLPAGFVAADILIRDDTIAAIDVDRTGFDVDSDPHEIDARGLVVAPGYIDVQCNGGHGIDLALEPERMWELASMLPRYGVTSWLPTIVSTPSPVVERAIATIASPPNDFVGAAPLGLHLEGPALNPLRRGAHPVGLLRLPTVELVDGWSQDRGVALVTLAPELTGGIDAVRALRAAGVVVAAGHTDATTDEMLDALEAGVTAVTHLFNGMVSFAHRDPGPVGIALTDERLSVGLIADGVHVHPIAVSLAYRAIGPSRLVLVTDAVEPMGLAGAADAARLPDGVLSGSTLTMDRAVRNLIGFTGCTPQDAITCASATPAALLGRRDRGTLAVGALADIALMTPDLEVVATIARGMRAFER